MERAADITCGAIQHIFNSGNASSHPVVQIVELKSISHSISNPDAPPRYRLAISDGTHFQQAMIATQLNVLITQKKLTLNCLVRIKEVICNTVQQKKIVIILNLEVVAPLPAKVGNPISIDAAMSGAAQNPGAGNQNAAGYGQNGFGAPQQPQNRFAGNQVAGNQGVQNTFGGNQGGQNGSRGPQNGFGGNAGAQPGFGAGGGGQNGFGGPQAQQSGFGNGSFGGGGGVWNAPQQQGKPYSNASFVSKMQSSPSTMYRPIQSINPYQNGWTIRGRCTYKSEIRKFMNSRGEGQVISFELTDESGSIRITGFTQHAQMIMDTVHMNRIYKVCRGSLKQANAKYNRSTSSFEMTLDRASVLEEIDDDNGSFMKIKYNFTKIADLESIEVKGNCDVVGVVTGVGPCTEITIRSTNDQCPRRSVTITDDSNASVELTLWRKQAESFLTEESLSRHPILLLRNASRGDFGGVCLNVSRMTSLELDPVNVDEANKLRAWFDNGGLNNAAIQSVTATAGSGGKITGPRKSLEEARVEDVDPIFANSNGMGGGTASFATRAVIGFVNTKNDLYYPGDPETKKKVVSTAPGLWSSESSGIQLTDEQVVWRYIISMKVEDHTGSKWVSGFDEIGQVLFGRPAKEFRDMKEQDPGMFENIIEDATFRPLLMKIQVKERTWNDAQQIRYTVSRAEPVDFASEGHQLLKEIASYGGM